MKILKILKIYETVRYMTFRQWKYRLYYTIRNRVAKRKPRLGSKSEIIRRLPMNYDVYLTDAAFLAEAKDILNNNIPTISGRIEKFGIDVDWDMINENYRLVCFRVNSFRYLFALSNAYKSTGDEIYMNKGFALIDDWIAKNYKCIEGDKWNPYVIADRLMNWIGFISEHCDEDKINYYAKCIRAQAIELKSSIEYQLGANHLLSEARTLIAVGAFLKDNEFVDYGKKVLIEEYETQFLDDGGHYERSVSYHVESLQQYYESAYILLTIGDKDAKEFIDLMKKPYQFLNNMIGVNGEIPLFNDAAIDYPFYDAKDFLSTASYLYETAPPNAIQGEYYQQWRLTSMDKEDIEWRSECLMKATGLLHYRFSTAGKKYSLYFDVGDNGPDSNLGHTHADALSVLLASDSSNIFVDSGVFTYESGEQRNLCRSTKAHNTIEVDTANSAEVWAAFRVARRGHAKIESYKETEGNLSICASHDGYKKILRTPVIHNRNLSVNPDEGEIYVIDNLICDSKHNAVLRYHINPGSTVKILNSCECVIDSSYRLSTSEPQKITKCQVASKFGELKESLCIECVFCTENTKEIKTKVTIKENSKNG